MLPAFGLYTHIRANYVRSVFLMGTLFMLVYLLTYAGSLAAVALTHNWGLQALLIEAWSGFLRAFPFVTLATLVWVAIGYFFNRQIIDAMIGGHSIARADEPKLYNMLENLCISRGIPTPRLEILETDVPNAFATGVNERQYSVTLTRGLINTLTDEEIEAVIAHELTHIRNGDVRMMVIAMVIAGVVAFVSEIIFRSIGNTSWRSSSRSGSSSRSSSSDNGKGKGGAAAAIAIVLLIVAAAWVLSLLIRFALSRTREYLADAGAVELTKNPDAMISALRKIDGKSEIPTAPSGIMEMCIDNPREGFADLFSTHPPIEARIQALIDYAGGRDVIIQDPKTKKRFKSPWSPAS
ncbi:MAG: M48 family metallopeptidase [Hyphomicrobiales bacterium]|nr:M48 family metallopeptidase [Hyphomicrobiales bacterium]